MKSDEEKFRFIVKDYKRHAERPTKKFPEGKGWSLSESFAIRLLKGLCNLCGVKSSNNYQGLAYNGIDRIDSSKGYHKGNVQTSCKRCNIGKGQMSHAEYLAHCDNVTRHNSDI